MLEGKVAKAAEKYRFTAEFVRIQWWVLDWIVTIYERDENQPSAHTWWLNAWRGTRYLVRDWGWPRVLFYNASLWTSLDSRLGKRRTSRGDVWGIHIVFWFLPQISPCFNIFIGVSLSATSSENAWTRVDMSFADVLRLVDMSACFEWLSMLVMWDPTRTKPRNNSAWCIQSSGSLLVIDRSRAKLEALGSELRLLWWRTLQDQL